MGILQYIAMAASTWFLGFFPYFEIYMAVPAGIVMGLPWIHAFLWATLGNWMVVVFIDLFYDWLLRFKFMKKLSDKALNGRWKERMEKGGTWVILGLTPLAGIWTTGIVAKVFGYDRKKLFVLSAISVSTIGFAIGLFTKLGVNIIG